MNAVQDEQPHLEVLSKAVTNISYILRASQAQTTGLIHTKAMPPGSHCGQRWPGRLLKTSGAKDSSLGF